MVISGCTVRNYTNRFVYVSLSGKIESLTIDDCIFIGADNSTTNKAIYASSAHTRSKLFPLLILHSLILIQGALFLPYKLWQRTSLDAGCIDRTIGTFYNCYDRRGVYLYNAGRSTIKNCISAFSGKKRRYQELYGLRR